MALVTKVAEWITTGHVKQIAFLTGAGISVAAGIPDFRSPGGMYQTLQPDLITATAEQRSIMELNPTAVVSRDMFFANQFPYLEVRRPFILGTQEQNWRATIGHRFIELCHNHGLLKVLLTQNIDGLDFQYCACNRNCRPPYHVTRSSVFTGQ
eukprot:m.244849 g.244849  ORF g.244849 m.244849 type:complete len:153 (+) comp15356_c0_seq36:4035-4493(+)